MNKFLWYAVIFHFKVTMALLAGWATIGMIWNLDWTGINLLLTVGTVTCLAVDLDCLVILWLLPMARHTFGLKFWMSGVIAVLWISVVLWISRGGVEQARRFLEYAEGTGAQDPLFFRDEIQSGELKPEDVEPDLTMAGPSVMDRLIQLYLGNPNLRPAIRRLRGKKSE